MLTRTPSVVAQAFLLLSVILIIAIAVIQINQQKILSPGLKYGIVLDAGSSRTTVYVYEWPAEKENDTGVVSQTFKCDVKGPGISSYEHNTGALAKPLDECLNKVKERIPVHLHKSTSLYLGATAGMRLLRGTFGGHGSIHTEERPWVHWISEELPLRFLLSQRTLRRTSITPCK